MKTYKAFDAKGRSNTFEVVKADGTVGYRGPKKRAIAYKAMFPESKVVRQKT